VVPSASIPAPPVVNLPAGDKTTRWNALRDLVQNDAVCRTHVRPGKKVVLGVGNLEAKIMFVGEAPGAEEEVQGEPFVGPAGQLLTKMIQAMGLARGDVYIGNIMNWRPEMPVAGGGEQYGNRPPTEEEMSYCLPYLRAQIELVGPELLVALGTTAAQGLLGFGVVQGVGRHSRPLGGIRRQAAHGDLPSQLHSAQPVQPVEAHDLGGPAQGDGAGRAADFAKAKGFLPR
jgi:DNA polymerase